MSEKKTVDDGGPASEETLLDRQAGKAMQSVFGCPEQLHAAGVAVGGDSSRLTAHVAKVAYVMATAMVAEKRRLEAAGKDVE